MNMVIPHKRCNNFPVAQAELFFLLDFYILLFITEGPGSAQIFIQHTFVSNVTSLKSSPIHPNKVYCCKFHGMDKSPVFVLPENLSKAKQKISLFRNLNKLFGEMVHNWKCFLMFSYSYQRNSKTSSAHSWFVFLLKTY